MMEIDSGTSCSGQDLSHILFAVKDEPLDFDLIGKVDGTDLELDLLMNGGGGLGSSSGNNGVRSSEPSPGKKTEKKVSSVEPPPPAPVAVTNSKKTGNASSSGKTGGGAGSVPQIGSSNSAFQPYKQTSLTILTNLQRGNVKTTNKETGPESLSFHEKAAKNSLVDADIVDSLVNAKDKHGYTPVMWASFHGRLHIVQKLVEKGAALDVYGPDGETALMFAASNGHSDVLSLLLENGAEADAEDDAGNTALMFASFGNHVECVVKLLKSGASMSRPNGIGDTPFEIAINKGHTAAQYAMEDFLKEQLELKFFSKAKKSPSKTAPAPGTSKSIENGHSFSEKNNGHNGTAK